MAITLRFTIDTRLPIETDCIRPDQWRGQSPRQIAALPCLLGNREAMLGDFFEITGNSDDEQIVIEGNCINVKWVGVEMASGQITMRRVDGWQALDQAPVEPPLDLAA